MASRSKTWSVKLHFGLPQPLVACAAMESLTTWLAAGRIKIGICLGAKREASKVSHMDYCYAAQFSPTSQLIL